MYEYNIYVRGSKMSKRQKMTLIAIFGHYGASKLSKKMQNTRINGDIGYN